MHEDCEFCIKRDICTRDVPKPCNYRYTEEEYRADQASDRFGAILNGTYLHKTYRKKKEDNEMKATSVQKIENVKDISFKIENDPAKMESKLTIVASTDDDIFAFEFEGADLLQSCKAMLKEENEKLKKDANEQPSSTSRADILDQAKNCVCGQREQDYGTPESNFQLIADLWNGYLFPSLQENKAVISSTDVSMMMALMKIARIRNGGGSGDSFVDLAGYAACGGEIWAEKKKLKDQN